MASFQKYNTKQGDRWLFKMYVGTDPITGKRIPTTRRGFLKKKDAQAAAADLQKEIDMGIYSKSSLTFREVFKEFWPINTSNCKPSTIATKASKFEKHILPRFANLKMKDITPAYCQKAITEIANSISTASAKDVKIQANLVFKFAIQREYILRNPMQHVITPSKEKDFLADEEEPRNFWEKEEIKLFLSLAKEEMDFQNYVMFHTLIYTGMRKGELAALNWTDINFSQQTININKTLFFKNNEYILQTAKTYKAKRIISIDEETAKLLSKLQTHQKEVLLADGITDPVKLVLIRNAEDIRYIRLAHPNDHLASFIRKHNLHYITVHGIRHTHASLLFAAGATIKDVQVRLGHKTIKPTMDIYTHVTKESRAEAPNKLVKYMES